MFSEILFTANGKMTLSKNNKGKSSNEILDPRDILNYCIKAANYGIQYNDKYLQA